MKDISNRLFLLLGSWVVFTACSANYAEILEKERAQKDEEMQNEDSPIPSWEQEKFTGLSYYPIDETYRVVATIERIPVGQYFTVSMTDGSREQYQKFGYAVFDLLGKEHRLLLLKNPRERNQLFLAFTDLSNGKESYGGGRYLDLEYNNSGKIPIDFNRSYNPFCAYSGQYACPIPPAENHLNIPVPAGEKLFESAS
ncbi:MAG: DUF1684 domain-containing protein [Bacteroidota bacterium]